MFHVSGNSPNNRHALDRGFPSNKCRVLGSSGGATASTHQEPRPLRLAKPLKMLFLAKDCSRQDLCVSERTVITGGCNIRGRSCGLRWSWPSSSNSMSRQNQPSDWAKPAVDLGFNGQKNALKHAGKWANANKILGSGIGKSRHNTECLSRIGFRS